MRLFSSRETIAIVIWLHTTFDQSQYQTTIQFVPQLYEITKHRYDTGLLMVMVDVWSSILLTRLIFSWSISSSNSSCPIITSQCHLFCKRIQHLDVYYQIISPCKYANNRHFEQYNIRVYHNPNSWKGNYYSSRLFSIQFLN